MRCTRQYIINTFFCHMYSIKYHLSGCMACHFMAMHNLVKKLSTLGHCRIFLSTLIIFMLGEFPKYRISQMNNITFTSYESIYMYLTISIFLKFLHARSLCFLILIILGMTSVQTICNHIGGKFCFICTSLITRDELFVYLFSLYVFYLVKFFVCFSINYLHLVV